VNVTTQQILDQLLKIAEIKIPAELKEIPKLIPDLTVLKLQSGEGAFQFFWKLCADGKGQYERGGIEWRSQALAEETKKAGWQDPKGIGYGIEDVKFQGQGGISF
jgi:hypothetical protein